MSRNCEGITSVLSAEFNSWQAALFGRPTKMVQTEALQNFSGTIALQIENFLDFSNQYFAAIETKSHETVKKIIP